MKTIALTTGTILFAVNGLFGFLLSGYDNFNLAFTSIVIAVTTLLLHLLHTITLKDGFVPGLGFMIALFGFICYILGLMSPDNVQDNGCVIVSIVLLTIETIILVMCHITSKSTK